MRSKRKQPSKTNPPVYCEITPKISNDQVVEPGAVGQAAINAAALNQLNRYARDIEEFLETSRMQAILNELSTDLNPEKQSKPQLRLRRD